MHIPGRRQRPTGRQHCLVPQFLRGQGPGREASALSVGILFGLVARGVGQEWLELSVSDEGPGIPENNLNLVFDRFYQGGHVRTGAGLGLAIAQEIVRAHGGSIRAANNLEKGAVFTVRLPTGHLQVTGEQPRK